MTKRATIIDVSEIAGVSIATVSRTINGNYPVKKETREKVLKAIEELDFTPNDIAVSMVKKKTKHIGVVVPSITNIFFSTLVKGITDYLDEHDYTTLLSTSRGGVKETVEKLISKQVDGIIIADNNMAENLEFYKKIHKSLPLIFINGCNNDFHNVSCNQKSITKDTFEYMKSSGHKKVLFVRGKEESYSYKLKEEIYNETFEDKKILFVPKSNSDDAIVNTKKSIEEYFKIDRDFTAIFACNDLMAIGALEALKKMHINVPKEISVIGFDNIFLCELVTPKLTSIDQSTYNMGNMASENIIKLLENSATDQKINLQIEGKLIERESS